ncbi:4'-phosphopantetheinyl transferase [Janibacter sp. Soil728]|uniref:holo-ACP synthase n=1 Tax=Janibacter sp. Soil728 TaxID=1736393 RepID=UPI0006F5397F|nr:holo-ACP synthase [Janibacter sp. Soil728]KRE37529.1 4'-phosphopantetheinyl transferase [Janibacter sp. Soil728]
MIVGVGVDIVDIARLGERLERTPALLGRVFTESERGLPLRSLAARFAAKEAVGKALCTPGDLPWQGVEVTNGEHGEPVLVISGTVAARAESMGVARMHISLSHDGGIATAFVVAESA